MKIIQKTLLVGSTLLLMNGCSYFTFNAAMCEKIASDPNAVMPEECQDYDEKKADKAFNKVINDKKTADKDIKFDKDDEK